MKVKIKSLGLSKAAYGQQANYGLSLSSPGSASAIRSSEHMMKPGLKPKKTITGVDRDKATLEAEGGETVVGQISGDGIVDHMTIKGPRHSNGGVPLDLPEDSFIFSDTRAMKINDPNILQMFGKKPKKGGYTPAELAKPYDISKYKAILMDPDTDRLSRNTAEIMIKNIVMKLGALALAQEAKKGFPQGIPEIAKPYMAANGISEEDLMPELKAQAEQMQAMQQQQAMQMQQAQAMQQQAPQGMPPMMPSGQPAAMPQQGMAPPQQPMMDPRQMMAMQQEQQMMPPQPQQGMPMAQEGFIMDDEIIPTRQPFVNVYEGPLTEADQTSLDNYFTTTVDPEVPFSPTTKPWYRTILSDEKAQEAEDYKRRLFENYARSGSSDANWNANRGNKSVGYRGYGQMLDEAKKYAYLDMDSQEGKTMSARDTRDILEGWMYGGTPMAAYGMQLGGYDMPFIMGTGGVPRYDHGGSHPEVSYEEAAEKDQATYDAAREEDGWVEYTEDGKVWKVNTRTGERIEKRTITPEERGTIAPGKGSYTMSDVCSWLNDPDSTWHNASYESLVTNNVISDTTANQEMYAECSPERYEEGSSEGIKPIIPPDDEEVEYCYCRDIDGNAIEGTKILRSELGEDEDGNLIECESIEFKDKYCTETYDEIVDEELKEEEGILPLPLMPMFKSRVPGQDKTPPPLRGRLDLALDDYRTALQTDQGMLEKNVEAIRNSNMPYGMKAAAIAQVMSQSKGSEIVSGVYRDNVNRMNDLYGKEAGLEQAYDQLRYQGDLAYDQAEGQRRQQQLATDNAQAQYMANYAKDLWKTQLMAGAIGTENYDWRSRFQPTNRKFDSTAGTMSYTDYKASYCEGKTEAECRAAFQAEMSGGDPNVAKYGKAVTPYVMASSVYPFLI